MSNLLRILFALVGFFLVDSTCRAQNLNFVWAEWGTTALEKRGPDVADGLLIYFHGAGVAGADKLPVPGIFVEMAKVATWDILRINRLPIADHASQDDEILQFTAEQVTRARRDGYKRIFIAGHSRGGWLALSAAALENVDGVVGMAPGASTLETEALERQRDLLARRLSSAKVKRVAAFFFEGDPRENTKPSRADVIRNALRNTRSAFMIVDRPPDLYGHSAAGSGRFVRRYRDCLLEFLQARDEPAGEVQCRSSGYAVGSDIGFPAASNRTKFLPDANKDFDPYVGRWRGEDEAGGYIIMESTEVGPKHIVFRFGYSPSPWEKGAKPWIREFSFQIHEANGGIFYRYPGGQRTFTATLTSKTELEVENTSTGSKTSRKFFLRRQGGDSAEK